MSLKTILEKKSTPELEKYLVERNHCTPESIHCAYTILQSRGRLFSEQESQQIMRMISSNKGKELEILVHPYHTKASHLLYLSAALGIGNLLWIYPSLNSPLSIGIVIFVLIFNFSLAYAISKGTEWAKYVLIVLFCFGLISLLSMSLSLIKDPALGFSNLIQTILQAWAILLLFKIPNTKQQ